MDSGYYAIMIGEAIHKILIASLWFSCGWFLIYVIVGPWIQVRLCQKKDPNISPHKKRIGLVFVSHLIFSTLLVNPYVFLFLAFALDDISIAWLIFLAVIYFLVFPIGFDLLIFRLISRWKMLRWFRWQNPLKRFLPVSLLLCLLAFGAGFTSIQLQTITPTVARSFPLRPKCFMWKVDTSAIPLIDFSLPAEANRMFTDGRFIYVRTDSKKPTWVTVDCQLHKLIKTEPTVLGYVLAGDSKGTWQVIKDADKCTIRRFDGGEERVISNGFPKQTIFLEHQVGGLVIGAIPSSGYLFAFDPLTGQEVWRNRAPAAKGNNDRRIGSLAGTENIIVAGLWTSRVWAVNPKTGEQAWLFEEKGYGNAMHVEASDAGVVGFSRSNKVYSFSPSDGELRWSKSLGDLAGGMGQGNACLLDNKVIFRDNSVVSCVDIDSGEICWKSEFGTHYSGGVSCSRTGSIACTSDRTLVLFDSLSGAELFQTKFPIKSGRGYGYSNNLEGKPGRIYTHPVIDDGSFLYVFAGDGVLWALKPNL